MILIFLGPPGSGKGTQGRLIATKYNLPYLATGDLLRQAAKGEGGFSAAQSAEINGYLSSGRLAPDRLVDELVASALKTDQYKKGCILDGYPRNVEQAKKLNLTRQGVEFLVFAFFINEEKLLARLLGRFNCSSCGASYSDLSMLKEENKCNFCQSTNFTRRADDKEEVIRERFASYKKETFPLVDFYQKSENAKLIEVDADQDIRMIEKELTLAINSNCNF